MNADIERVNGIFRVEGLLTTNAMSISDQIGEVVKKKLETIAIAVDSHIRISLRAMTCLFRHDAVKVTV